MAGSIVAEVPEYSSINLTFPGDVHHLPNNNIDSKIKGDTIRINNARHLPQASAEKQILNLKKTKGELVELTLSNTELSLGSYLEAKEGFIRMSNSSQGEGKRLGASEQFELLLEDKSSLKLLGLFKNEEEVFSKHRIFRIAIDSGSSLQVENMKGCFEVIMKARAELKVKECNF